jgi:hypothetical protein
MLIPTSLLQRGFRAIVGWFDDRSASPIMRRRVNKGSDEFFSHETRHRGETEFDEILDPAGAESDDDDSPQDALTELEDAYDSAKLRVASVAVMLAAVAVFGLGLRGIGPLARFARLTVGSDSTRTLLLGLAAVVGVIRLVLAILKTFDLRRELARVRSSRGSRS